LRQVANANGKQSPTAGADPPASRKAGTATSSPLTSYTHRDSTGSKGV